VRNVQSLNGATGTQFCPRSVAGASTLQALRFVGHRRVAALLNHPALPGVGISRNATFGKRDSDNSRFRILVVDFSPGGHFPLIPDRIGATDRDRIGARSTIAGIGAVSVSSK
jgi:hypothetical protein